MTNNLEIKRATFPSPRTETTNAQQFKKNYISEYVKLDPDRYVLVLMIENTFTYSLVLNYISFFTNVNG